MDQQGEFEIITSGTTAIALTSTGDKFVVSLPVPFDVYEWGVIVTTGLDATLRQINLDKRITAGSDSGRVNDAGGAQIAGSAAVAAGTVLYRRPAAPVQVNPGEQLVFEVTDAAVAGAGVLYVKGRKMPATAPRITALVAGS